MLIQDNSNLLHRVVDMEYRFCLVCASDTAENEHHFVFDCPSYCSIRDRFTSIFWRPAPTLSSFFTLHGPRVIAKFFWPQIRWWSDKVATEPKSADFNTLKTKGHKPFYRGSSLTYGSVRLQSFCRSLCDLSSHVMLQFLWAWLNLRILLRLERFLLVLFLSALVLYSGDNAEYHYVPSQDLSVQKNYVVVYVLLLCSVTLMSVLKCFAMVVTC